VIIEILSTRTDVITQTVNGRKWEI